MEIDILFLIIGAISFGSGIFVRNTTKNDIMAAVLIAVSLFGLTFLMTGTSTLAEADTLLNTNIFSVAVGAVIVFVGGKFLGIKSK